MSERKTTVTPQIHEPQETPREIMTVAREQLLAASIGNVDWLRLSMKAADSQVRADRYGFTALHMAAIHGRLQCLKLLLEDYGLDVNAPSGYGWRALHLVMNQKSGRRAMPCLRYLLQRGANLNVKSQNLTTPLHRAASEGLEDCLAILVEAGADVHAKDLEGNKPIDLCHLWCRRASARYLHSATWKKDKEDYAQELKKMEKVIQDIGETEKSPLYDDEETKNLTEKFDMVRLEINIPRKSRPGYKYVSSGEGRRIPSKSSGEGRRIPSKKVKKGTTGIQSNRKSPKERGEHMSGSNTVSRRSFWNASTNPRRPQILNIERLPALWQGIYSEDVTKKDLSSRVLLTKDEQGQLQIQTLQGQIYSPPDLPYKVIERSLFPQKGPQDRIKTPKDFKTAHVFDVPRKLQPTGSPKPASEISFHLRRDLDSKFRKSHREAAPPVANLQY